MTGSLTLQVDRDEFRRAIFELSLADPADKHIKEVSPRGTHLITSSPHHPGGEPGRHAPIHQPPTFATCPRFIAHHPCLLRS